MRISKIVEQQLKKVQAADLSNYNKETNTYYIKRRMDIKIEEDGAYIIQLKPFAFANTAVINNWNNGSFPKTATLKIDVNRRMSNMVKVVSVGYDLVTREDLPLYWSGWLAIDNFDIIEKL